MTSRRRTPVVVAIALLLVVASATGAWWGISNYRATHGPECTVSRPQAAWAASVDVAIPTGAESAQGSLGLDAVQLQHASTINAVGLSRGEPGRARVIAVATAWQESSLRNLDHGDRDSLGLFQQRTSQGWGKPAQIMDPVYAAGQFYDHLAKVPGWESMPLADAAQAVQRSGFPDAYAKWEWDAATLVDALSGADPTTVTCRRGATGSTAAAPVRPAAPGAALANDALAQVLAAAKAEFGSVAVTSVALGGDAATVTISLPGAGAGQAAGALAAWSVAHSASFGVDEVVVGDQQWSHAWRRAASSLPAGEVRVKVGSS